MWEFMVIHYATQPIDMKAFYTNYDEGFQDAIASVSDILSDRVDDEETLASIISGFNASKAKLKTGGFIRDPCTDSVWLYVTHYKIIPTENGLSLEKQQALEKQMPKNWTTKLQNKRTSSF